MKTIKIANNHKFVEQYLCFVILFANHVFFSGTVCASFLPKKGVCVCVCVGGGGAAQEFCPIISISEASAINHEFRIDSFGVSNAILLGGANSGQTSIKCCDQPAMLNDCYKFVRI